MQTAGGIGAGAQATKIALNLAEIAARYSVSYRTTVRWLQHGLPFSQVYPRGKILVRVEDLERFLQRRCKAQTDLNAVVNDVMTELSTKVPRPMERRRK